MSVDQLETFGTSLLQHGAANDRVYLMKLAGDDLPGILDYIDELVERHDYSKVFAKIPETRQEPFTAAGYQPEARIPSFYNGEVDGLFMARYAQPERRIDPDAEHVAQVLRVARDKAAEATDEGAASSADCRLATPQDCEEMAGLYRRVFRSYPFPIHDPDYLSRTMNEQVVYAGVWHEGELAALASAEVDAAGGHAEMTDFATAPEHRGQGLANHLLRRLEGLFEESAIQTSYTIARATSYGMNITFAKSGYRFAGTLVKNTQISGGLESMNVWYKSLS
ncbi:MAG: putative beta-lysine N-acetyltransferase [Pelovirga sp.]